MFTHMHLCKVRTENSKGTTKNKICHWTKVKILSTKLAQTEFFEGIKTKIEFQKYHSELNLATCKKLKVQAQACKTKQTIFFSQLAFLWYNTIYTHTFNRVFKYTQKKI